MEGGRRARSTSNRNSKESTWTRASRHTINYAQTSVDVLEAKTMEGGRRARSTSDGDSKEGTRVGASRHAAGHAQPGIHFQVPKPRPRGRFTNGKLLPVAETDSWSPAS